MINPKQCCGRTPWYDTIISKNPKDCYACIYCNLCKRMVYSYKSMSKAISNWNRKVNK
jgi:hypothetical protein